jgi:hypothetical protein
MNFLEENIFSRFGFRRKLITYNAQEFKFASTIDFCEKYNITLEHSTPYYPQGNSLEESSNKSLIIIIKKLLPENKRAWDSKLKYAFWANMISTKKNIGTYTFQLVYGEDSVLPIQLGFRIMKFL